MSLISNLFGSGRKEQQKMLLDVEGRDTVEAPDLDTLLSAVRGLALPAPTFLCLTHLNGDYLQIVGARPWSRVELRVQTPLSHSCAFQETPNPRYADGVTMKSGAGEIVMAHDEWFLLKDAAEIFAAFYKREAFPPYVQWRSMNEMFEI